MYAFLNDLNSSEKMYSKHTFSLGRISYLEAIKRV